MAGAKSDSKNRKSASVAGVSGGTGLVAIAQLLPLDLAWLKAILTFAAPAATIVVSVLWVYLQVWIQETVTQLLRRRAMNSSIKYARKMRDKVVKDPKATNAHKRQAQENLQKMETLAFEMAQAEAKSITAKIT